MNNSEFESQAYADPDCSKKDFLDALNDNPSRSKLLEEIKDFNQRLCKTIHNETAPEGLAAKLKTSVQYESQSTQPPPTKIIIPKRRWRPYHGIAMAAVLILAVGITSSGLFSRSNPSAADLAFGQLVMDHVYTEQDELGSTENVNNQMVRQVVDSVGGHMRDSQEMVNLQFSFAKPCVIVRQSNGAHLVLEGSKGAVNIIVIKNSPVQTEFPISDERFIGTVIPFASGNLILIGEKGENLANYRKLLAENVEWTI